ncbi:CocE/NonD family hydrolase [Saccharopolyspora rhizosphaerae]|uniref:CocE/NonD family hydrolase n=1 Tax=Saccharopolyspora rhizosphaerae TaxID=2492662 RepID=A0A3R8Q739_9PSEU|nr:CocE/NonD family hydrolase [Saccharopolyspora rhizosphaerae]RRO19920.1 CocE/NonD family hydrolase [Saccharopolyspora rhizosphaerae]
MRRSLLALLLALLAALAGLPAAHAAPNPAWSARGEDYPGAVAETDVPVPMSDGTVLRADVKRPAGADGEPVDGRFPVLVTITAYNKTIISGPGAAAIGDPDYFVKRGYVHVSVDARGTGSSGGDWQAFSARENTDAGEIVNWAASQERPWSGGSVGMLGASYMGISQLLAAGNQPPGLKAIFPQVPAMDTYRDVVASGGALDVGFIPLWLGLVTATGLVPPAYGPSEPDNALQMYLDRVQGATSFTAPTLLEATLGLNAAFDGPFYAERSPAGVLDRIDVPTFLIGGEYDLFQRGTPMVFDHLRQRGVPVKMVLGPWDHLEGSRGDISEAGHGTLQELQLRWFDHHVRGDADPSLDADIAPLTYYEIGSGQWHEADQWIDEQRARSFQLSGTSLPGVPGRLVDADPEPGQTTVAPVPVSGLCTRSTNQWTAGLPNAVGIAQLCHDNRWNDVSGAVFETEPVDEAVRLRGPINARLRASTPTGNGMLSVSVSSVAPDGAVDRLTGGWQVLSHRALDESRSRYLDGELIQPFHPFTKEAQSPLEPGAVEPVDVEVFPTGAVIPPGHKLRVSVQAFDVPHLLPTVRDLPAALSPVTLHTSPEHPSEITLPVIPASAG